MVTNKYLILDIIFFSSFRQGGFAYLHQASKSLRKLLRENFKAALYLSEDALEHIEELPRTTSKVELPRSRDAVFLVLLSGDRLYTSEFGTLNVYSVSDLTSPIASFDLPENCISGLIANNCLFLGASNCIIVYEISASLTEPLKQLSKIKTIEWILKMITVGQELVLGEKDGYL